MIETFVPLPFVALFAGLFLLLASFRLRWAIAMTIVFLPAYLLRFHVGPLPSTFLEVMLLIVIGVWLVRTTVKREWRNVRVPWKFLLIAILIDGLIEVLAAPDLRAALGLNRAYLLEPILFFWVFVNVVRDDRAVRLTVWALAASTLFVAVVADMQSTGLVPVPEPYASEVPARMTSVYPFPTAVGKYLGPLVALFLALLLITDWRSKPVKRLLIEMPLLLFVLGEGVWALWISVSRGAMLGVLAALVFASFFSRLKKWIWLALLLVVVATFVYPATRADIQSVFSRRDTSTDVHLVLWQGALNLAVHRPVFGTGLAGFPHWYEKFKLPQHIEFFPNPDQFILTLWIEMGLAGLLLFILLFVRIFRQGFAFVRASSQQPAASRRIVIAVLTAMVALLVHGLVDTPYFKNDLAVQFWVLVGLLVILTDREKLNA